MRWLSMLLTLAAVNALGDTCVFLGPWSVRSPNGRWQMVISNRFATLLESNKPRAHWRLASSHPMGPMAAMVANDGTLVTFGNGCSEGPSTSDVVIYRPDGKLVRSLGMRDFMTAEDIATLPRSVSSTHWSGRHRIDEETQQLVLDVQGPPRGFVMPISLESGEPLQPVRRHFYVPEYEPVVTIEPAKADGRCDDAEELAAHARELQLPPYPVVAQKARIAGDVIVEVRVDGAGALDGVRLLKPLPFGLDRAVEETVRGWRFAPPGRPACGRFVTHFARRLVPPPALD